MQTLVLFLAVAALFFFDLLDLTLFLS